MHVKVLQKEADERRHREQEQLQLIDSSALNFCDSESCDFNIKN